MGKQFLKNLFIQMATKSILLDGLAPNGRYS
jgi:hypothetical protein